MKVTSAVLVLALVCYGESTLKESFDKGVVNAPDLHWMPFLEGSVQQLKAALKQAFSDFTYQIDQALSQNATMAIRGTDQRLKNYNNLFEFISQNIKAGSASSNAFDQFLGSMEELYDGYADLVAAVGANNEGKKVLADSWWYLEWIFLHLEENVKSYLNDLQQWSADVVKSGVQQEIVDLKAIQKSYQDNFIYSEVKFIQSYVNSLMSYESRLQTYSSHSAWEKYTIARNRILGIND